MSNEVNFRILRDGIRHPQLGDTVLRWDEILYVDYREIKNQRGHGSVGQVIELTVVPEAIIRINMRLSFFKRYLLEWIHGNSLLLNIGSEPPLHSELADVPVGVQIFNELAQHIPKRERIAKSGLETLAEVSITQNRLSTAIDMPRPPRSLRDSAKLLLAALVTVAVPIGLIALAAIYL